MKKPLPFGKYVLVERIAIGGMAEVFLAKSFGVDGFERALAIKRILPSMVEDKEFITMFRDEARIAAVLSHANIAQVHEFEKVGEHYYMAMEYVSGRDLRSVFTKFRAEKKGLPVPVAVYCMAKVCEGLDYAHRKKDQKGQPLHIIHRDVSPQNVLASFDGEVKIIDFGIAKAANRAMKTQAGVLKGKFGYMSPEQVSSEPIDHRSDIFAAGIVLWEILTGQKLFAGDSDMSTLERVRSSVIVPPTRVNPDIPRDLEQVVMKALARLPDHRYASASDLQEDLARFLVQPDGSVFGAKALAAWLRETFPEEYQREQERLARHAHVLPPSDEPDEDEADTAPRVSRLDDTRVFLDPARPEDEVTHRLTQNEIVQAQRRAVIDTEDTRQSRLPEDDDDKTQLTPSAPMAPVKLGSGGLEESAVPVDEDRTMASRNKLTIAAEDRTMASKRAAPAEEQEATRASRPPAVGPALPRPSSAASDDEGEATSAARPERTQASPQAAAIAAQREMHEPTRTERSPRPTPEHDPNRVDRRGDPAPIKPEDTSLMSAALGGVEDIRADEATNTFSRRRRRIVPWLGTGTIVGAALAAGALAYFLVGSGPPATLIVIGRPADVVQIFVDGKPVVGSPYIGQDLEPGPHRIEIRAPGRRTFVQDVVLESGKAMQIEKDLVADGAQ